MKKLIILCLGIIGVFLIVQCSKFINNTKVYVDTQLEVNHDDENERKSYYDNDSSQESEALNDKYLNKEENKEYDIYAYDLKTREIQSRNGQREYVYGGNVISSTQAEKYGYHTTPITKEGDKTIKFWRNDVKFVPEKGEIVLVRFPKGNHKTFVDIELMYKPTGEPNGEWNW
ncbi:hypothetical protein [Bacillus velezensis]|uniref:hypothetical protein n=1 Tax=Bacillus velezensis TaxID=492670 RepID=UPI00215A7CB6|nr:hypothetical protein [Bacillus velezensis]